MDEPKRSRSDCKPTSLLAKISQRCQDKRTHEICYRCKGSIKGKNCPFSLSLPRTLKHACHCWYLCPKFRAQANVLRSDESPGAQVEMLEHGTALLAGTSTPQVALEPASKRQHTLEDVSPVPTASGSSFEVIVGNSGCTLLQARICMHRLLPPQSQVPLP